MTQLPLDLPSTDNDIFGYTTCDHTGDVVKLTKAVKVTKHFGGDRTDELHFRDEAAANEYYLERLRESGL